MVFKDTIQNTEAANPDDSVKPIVLAQMTPDDRPRDKAWCSTDGVKCLTVTELISIIICRGKRDTPSTVLAQDLFAHFDNSLYKLSTASLKEISSIHGIGKIKATALCAAIELGIRCRDNRADDKKTVTCADDIFWLMRGILEHKNTEEFWIIVMNRRYRVIGKPVRISTGTAETTPVTVKMVFRRVLEFGDDAHSVAFVHNHPDGMARPSADDIMLTSLLCETARTIIDIEVFDHVIVTPEGKYYSFKEHQNL